MIQVAAVAIKRLRDASKSEAQVFHPTYKSNEIYINDRFIGKVDFKSETDFGILHISLQLNQFSDEIHINRSNL